MSQKETTVATMVKKPDTIHPTSWATTSDTYNQSKVKNRWGEKANNGTDLEIRHCRAGRKKVPSVVPLAQSKSHLSTCLVCSRCGYIRTRETPKSETCAKSRSRDSGAGSLGVVRANVKYGQGIIYIQYWERYGLAQSVAGYRE